MPTIAGSAGRVLSWWAQPALRLLQYYPANGLSATPPSPEKMDRVAQALAARGFVVTPKALFVDGYSGFHFEVGHVEIIFRLDDDDETVMIPLYRRLGPRVGMRNSYLEMWWFLEFLQQPDLGVTRVKGLIRALNEAREGDLPSERIAEFYRRMFGAGSLGFEDGEEWMHLELKDLKPMRAAYREAVEKATRESNH